MTPVPKPFRAKSKIATDSARGRACTLRWAHCNEGNETTIFAHVRIIGTGISTKPHDCFGFYACARCHTDYDQHLDVPDDEVIRAIYETQNIMLAEGIMTLRGSKL